MDTTLNQSSKSGFTLIELSVVLVIIGLLMSAMGSMAMVYSKAKALKTTQDNLAKVQMALKSYLLVNGSYPCPASRQARRGTMDFGKAPKECLSDKEGAASRVSSFAPPADISVAGRNDNKVRIGLLPFRSLGIADGDAVDGWSHIFQYAVTEKLTDADQFDQKEGAIDVVAEDKKSRLIRPASAQYVVISNGENGAAGYSRDGVLAAPCQQGVLETENCNDDAVFMDAQTQLTPVGGWHEARQLVSYDDHIAYQEYDPTFEGRGGLLFLYQDSCMKGFVEIDLKGRNTTEISILSKKPASSPKRSPDTLKLCLSNRYSVSMILPTNDADRMPACPEGWADIGYKLFEKDWDNDNDAPTGFIVYQVCAR